MRAKIRRNSNNCCIVDAFVALGGGSDREGTISKNTLIEIIKTEFELTIDMEVRTFHFSFTNNNYKIYRNI